MRNRFITAAVLGAFLLAMLPSVALATGDCTRGKVKLWQHADLAGNWVLMCYGVNDSNTSSEDGTGNIGPDSAGNIKADFDNSSTGDGMSSFQLTINPATSTRWCYYYSTSYSQQMFNETSSRTNTLNILENDQGSSLRWRLGSESC